MSRKIEITIDEKFLDSIGGSLGPAEEKAIGYLATWAFQAESKRNVSIYCDSRGEMGASYSDDAGNRTYFIGAVRRDEETNPRWSFHS